MFAVKTLAGHAPSEGLRKESFLLLPAAGGSWRSLACGLNSPIAASVTTWPSLCVCASVCLLLL